MANVMLRRALVAAVLAALASPAGAETAQYTIHVDGLACPFCAATSEKALRKIDGVSRVKSNLEDGTFIVCADAKTVDFTDAQLAQLFKEKGFTYRGMEKTAPCEPL
jgi:mercuric ion binding protein